MAPSFRGAAKRRARNLVGMPKLYLDSGPGANVPSRNDNYTCRSTIAFFNSAICLAGLRLFGQALEQFRIVWQR
jgi:hypothetical protein